MITYVLLAGVGLILLGTVKRTMWLWKNDPQAPVVLYVNLTIVLIAEIVLMTWPEPNRYGAMLAVTFSAIAACALLGLALFESYRWLWGRVGQIIASIWMVIVTIHMYEVCVAKCGSFW